MSNLNIEVGLSVRFHELAPLVGWSWCENEMHNERPRRKLCFDDLVECWDEKNHRTGPFITHLIFTHSSSSLTV
jgi:hypothetical protein